MVGIVLVSHSRKLAEGVADLARAMGSEDVPMAVAGGIDDPDQPLGTDATAVAEAIEEAWSNDGVLVLMDLGSAVLSAEMAVEMLPEDRRENVRLTEAPLVEGAVAAVVASKLGEPLGRVAQEARAGLTSKSSHLGEGTEAGGEPGADRETAPDDRGAAVEGGQAARLRIDNQLGLHARPAARFVQTAGRFDADVTVENITSGRGPVGARSLNAVATLGVRRGHEILVRARGPQAEEALAALRDLADRNFDEPAILVSQAPPPPSTGPRVGVRSPARSEARDRERAAAVGAVPPKPGVVLTGMPTSPGIAVGEARRFRVPVIEVPQEPSADHQAEIRALEKAIEATREDIFRTREIVAARGADYEAAIFDAHLLFLEDDALIEPARKAILEDGRNAAAAWNEAADRLCGQWEGLDDEYLRERAADLRSVADRVLAHLLGVEGDGPTLSAPGILIAADLSPAETARLDPELVLGIATAFGGPTSHSAILARSLGIPAAVGLGPAIEAIEEGTRLLIDGEAGALQVEPPDEAVREAERRLERRLTAEWEAARAAAEPAVTRDGTRIEVAANIGSPDDVAAAVEAGADAVGLLRTEFLFQEARHMPDQGQQEAAYRAVAEALESRPLIVRTLDVGSDKPVPFLAGRPEANPALGLRGLRLGLARPHVLEVQLSAVLRVAADHPVRVMFPMLATLGELQSAGEVLERARGALAARGEELPERLEVGVMIEVPAAALTAAALAPEVDFFSIGTNDLAQYTLAADRGNDEVAALADAMHPAVLQLIRRTVDAAQAHGRWVGVCGEVAGDPLATPILVGLGVTELSMNPRSIPLVKRAVRRLDVTEARSLAERALGLESAGAVRTLAGAAFPG